jgi:hypothetical protein
MEPKGLVNLLQNSENVPKDLDLQENSDRVQNDCLKVNV